MSKNNDFTDYTSFGEKWVNPNSSNSSSPKNDFTKNTETSSGIFGNQTNDFIQSQINKSVDSKTNENFSSGQDDMTLERTRDYVNDFVNKHTGNPIDNGSSSSNQNNGQQNNGYSPSQPHSNNSEQKQSYSNGSNGYNYNNGNGSDNGGTPNYVNNTHNQTQNNVQNVGSGYTPTVNYGVNPVDAYVPNSSNYTKYDAVNPTVSNPYENYGSSQPQPQQQQYGNSQGSTFVNNNTNGAQAFGSSGILGGQDSAFLQQQQNNNGTTANVNGNAPDLVSNFVNNAVNQSVSQVTNNGSTVPTYTTEAVNFSGNKTTNEPPANKVHIEPQNNSNNYNNDYSYKYSNNDNHINHTTTTNNNNNGNSANNVQNPQNPNPINNGIGNSGAGILSGQNNDYVKQQTNHYNTAFNTGTTQNTMGGSIFNGNELLNYANERRRNEEQKVRDDCEKSFDTAATVATTAGVTAVVNNVSTAQAEQIQKMIDGAIPVPKPKVDVSDLSRYSAAFNIQKMAQHSDVISGSAPFRDTPRSVNTDAHFDMNKSYGGYNYGNNNSTAKSGFSGNAGNTSNTGNNANPTFVTFENANNYVSFGDANSYNYEQGSNWNYSTNSSSDINEPIKVANPQSKPIYNYQADNYSNGPFGNMNNAYGGQNLLLNPYSYTSRSNRELTLGEAVQKVSNAQDRVSDAQTMHIDRAVRDMKDKQAMAMALLPINEIVDSRRQARNEQGVTNYYNQNKIADKFKQEFGSHENLDIVDKKFNQYKAKCSQYGTKPISYEKFMEKGIKGRNIDITNKDGQTIETFKLDDNKSQNIFCEAKSERISRDTIMKQNNNLDNIGRGDISNNDFNEMRSKNYSILNKKMKLDGFKGTEKQMQMLRAADRKLDKNNMFKDLSDADVKEIEEFVEINGANLGAFHSVYVNNKQRQGANLIRSKLADSTMNAGASTVSNYSRIARESIRTSIAARNHFGSKHVDKALEKLERSYKAGNLSASHYQNTKDLLNAKKDVFEKSKDLHGTQKHRGRIDKRKTSAYKEKKEELKDLKNVRKEKVKKQRRNRRSERRTTGHEKSFLQRRRDYHRELVKEKGRFPQRTYNGIKNGFKNGIKQIKNIPKNAKAQLANMLKIGKLILKKLIVPAFLILGLLFIAFLVLCVIGAAISCIGDLFSWGSSDDNLDTNQFQTLNTISTQYENETLIPRYKNAAKDGADLTGLYSSSDNWNKNVYNEVDIKDIVDENNNPTNFCNCLQIFSLYSYYRQNHWDWQSDNPQSIFNSDIQNVIDSTHGYDNVTYTDVYHNDLSGCDNIKYHSDLVYSKANYYDANKTYTYNYNGYEWTATGYLDTQKFASDFNAWSANCVNRNDNNAANYTKTITDDGTDTYKYTVTLNRTEQVPVYRTDPVYGQQWVTKYETSTVISATNTSLKQGLWVQSSSNSLSTKNNRDTISKDTNWSSLTAKERHNKSNRLYTQKELEDLGFSISAPSGNTNSSWYSGGLGEYIYYRPVCASNGKYQLIAYKFKDSSGYETVQTGTQQVLDHYDSKQVTEVLTYPIPTITYKCKGHCAGHVKVAMDLTNKSDIRNINNIMGTTVSSTHYSTLSEEEISAVEDMIGTYDTHYVDGVTNWKQFDVYFMGAEGWMDDEAIQNVVNSLGTITTNNVLVPAGGGAPGIINAGTTEGKQELINQGLSLCNGAFVYGHSGRGNLYATGGNTDCSGYVSRCIFQALKAQGVPDDDPRMVAIKRVPTTVDLLRTCPNGYAAIGGDVSKLAPGTVIVRQNQAADAGSNGTTGLSNHTIIYIGPMDVDGDGQLDDGGKPYVLECTTSGGKSGPMFHTRNWSYLNAYGYYCNWL